MKLCGVNVSMSITKKKEKNIILPLLIIVLIVVLAGLISGIFLKWQPISKIAEVTPPAQEVITGFVPSTKPNAPDRSTINKNGYPLYMIEGIVSKIYSENPLKFDISVKVGKIFPDRANEEIIKTVVTKNTTEYVLNNLQTKKNTVDKPASLKASDNIVVWIEELNTDVFVTNRFTATKIIRFQ